MDTLKCKVIPLISDKKVMAGDLVRVTEDAADGNYSFLLQGVENHFNYYTAIDLYLVSHTTCQKGDYYIVNLYDVESNETQKIEKVQRVDGIWVNNFDVTITRHINNCKKIIASTDKSLGLPLIPKTLIDKYITDRSVNNRYKKNAPVEYNLPLKDGDDAIVAFACNETEVVVDENNFIVF